MLMVRSCTSRLVILVSTVVLLTGCASDPQVGPIGPSPDIRLGPVLELLQFKTSRDHVDTLLDDQGNAHVIIAAASAKEVNHVVVSPDGKVQRESVASDSSPSAISAAFDGEARLHLLLDDRHLVREASTWMLAHDTPWEAAGIKMHRPRLVQGKNGFAWAFLVEGEEVGAKGRWDWYGFGGGFGAIVFPWHSASQKLVVVPDAAIAEPLWYVLDPQDNLDTANAMLAVDGNENLHVVYDAARGGMAASGQPRYARVPLIPPSTPSDGSSDNRTDKKQLYSFSGSQIPFIDSARTGLIQATSAVDPASGTVLIVRANDASYALTQNNWSLPLKLPLSCYFEPKLVPAGGDAFHLMTSEGERVLYLLYAQGNWSAPVELGQANVASGSIWGALGIAGHGHNRAFVVWPTKTGIVGRWVEGAREFQALPGGGADQQAGANAIPEHLLEFANGKAELITPGWTTGIAAAVAAETNGPLTKQLHDSGQWKTLAAVVLKDNYGDNLRWYYLGRAAEGMGLCDTAEHYYRISKQRSERFETRCLSVVCRGFTFPEILQERLNAVGAMRSTGKCSVPPRMNN
jgi:hypothetical protein